MRDVESDSEELLEAMDVDDDLRLDDDAEVPATAQDGGTLTHQPERFATMLGPQELAQSGPALEWGELREIVADDGHWSDDLEIHPDRVQPGTLKSNHKLASRIVAAMARSTANGGIVPGPVLDELIEDSLGHLHDRADTAAGRQYIVDTYEPLVRHHLWFLPHPDNRGVWTEKAAHIEAVEARIADPWSELPEALETEVLLDPGRYQDAMEIRTWNGQEWHADLGEWPTGVAALRQLEGDDVVEQLAEPADLVVKVPDEYADVRGWLLNLVQDLLQRFTDAVSGKHREAVLEHHVSTSVKRIVRSLTE
jgi:hypothetical protein